ncbi:hypothetical protein D3C81_443940 [compost metagenome]
MTRFLRTSRFCGHQASSDQLGGHVGHTQLNGLVLVDGHAEGATLAGIALRFSQSIRSQADSTGGDSDTTDFERVQQVAHAQARLATDNGSRRHLDLGKQDLDGVDLGVGHLVKFTFHGNAWEGFFNQEKAQSWTTGFGIDAGTSQRQQQSRTLTVGHKDLGAIDHEVRFVCRRNGGDRLQVGTGCWLGQTESATVFTGRHQRQVLALLLFGTVLADRIGDSTVAIDEGSQGCPAGSDGFHHGSEHRQAQLVTAVLFRNGQTEQTHFLHRCQHLCRERLAQFELLNVGPDFFGDVLTDGFENFFLDIVKIVELAHAVHPPSAAMA